MVSVSAIFCSNKAFSKVLRGKDSQSPTTTRSISLKLIHVRLDHVDYIYYFLLKSNTDTCQWNELHITYNVKTSSIHLQLKWIITTYNSYIHIMKTEKIIAVKVVRGICFRIERERERDHFKYLGSKWERKRGGRVSEPLCPTTDYSNVTLALQLQLPCNQLSITTATTTTTTTNNIANNNGQEIPLLLRWKMIPIKP